MMNRVRFDDRMWELKLEYKSGLRLMIRLLIMSDEYKLSRTAWLISWCMASTSRILL